MYAQQLSVLCCRVIDQFSHTHRYSMYLIRRAAARSVSSLSRSARSQAGESQKRSRVRRLAAGIFRAVSLHPVQAGCVMANLRRDMNKHGAPRRALSYT